MSRKSPMMTSASVSAASIWRECVDETKFLRCRPVAAPVASAVLRRAVLQPDRVREEFNQSQRGGREITVLSIGDDEAAAHAEFAGRYLFQSRRIGI